MNISRRAAILALLASAAAGRQLVTAPAAAAPADGAPSRAVRIGILRYGTVSWELETIRRQGYDRAEGITIEPVELATSQATQIALQADRVDMVVLDWLWVTRQRSAGSDWTFVPFSNAVGGIVAPQGSPVRRVEDLPGRRLGIAGSPLDKSWLILRAYARRQHDIDLDAKVEKSFGAPPLLAEELKAGRLDAMLTFWPFAAKAEAAGMHRVLAIEDAIVALGIAPGVPVVGYVFSERWAERNRPTLDGFIAASRRARGVLAASDPEWQRLAPLTGAVDAAELERLKAWYRRGIPQHWGEAERLGADQLFRLLAEIGGPSLVGPATSVAPGTFWSAAVL